MSNLCNCRFSTMKWCNCSFRFPQLNIVDLDWVVSGSLNVHFLNERKKLIHLFFFSAPKECFYFGYTISITQIDESNDTSSSQLQHSHQNLMPIAIWHIYFIHTTHLWPTEMLWHSLSTKNNNTKTAIEIVLTQHLQC